MSESETDWKTRGFLPDAWKKSAQIISNQKKRGISIRASGREPLF